MMSIPFDSTLFAQVSRPNVLIIYSDDQGSIDVNCYGARDLETPNMDRLAETGVRFSQMLAPGSVCTPSRAGLMTGRIPWRVGLPSNAATRRGGRGMEPAVYTVAELFRDNGYRTSHIGKWHLGFQKETMPTGQGFNYSFGHMGGCIDFYYWGGPNQHDLWRNAEEVWEDGENFGGLMVRELKAQMDQANQSPFFIYWAVNWPHYPLQGFAKWRKHYAHLPPPRNMYAAFVSSLDDLIGEVVNHLEETGKRKNTILLFQSDHGHSIEERTFSGGGDSGPYRGHKGSLFEGGLRVPSIVSWPGRIPQGQVRDQFVTGCDWFPTFAEYCRIQLPENLKLDGESITRVIKSGDAASPHPDFFWSNGRKNPSWAVRKGQWKLLGNPRDGRNPKSLTDSDKLFLVDLDQDISETKNLREEFPDKVSELQKIRREYEAGIQRDLQVLYPDSSPVQK
ncbi:MAG TPA: sulfatase [Verrucomicrobiales bacterium]|nr:sulfatase [Verrucomicrobiales bacterium]